MFEELACTCRACDRELGEGQLGMVYRDDGGKRHAYECGCGAVTITVTRDAPRRR